MSPSSFVPCIKSYFTDLIPNVYIPLGLWERSTRSRGLLGGKGEGIGRRLYSKSGEERQRFMKHAWIVRIRFWVRG